MKFHHLARHGQLAAQARDTSPSKQQQQQQQATSLQKQAASNSLSDEEEDDFNDPHAFYDSIADHQHSIQNNGQVANGQATGVAVDTSGFLMDKNKKLFPQKLWELIHNPSIQHCLRWSQDGQRVYLNRNEFEAYYLKTPNNQFHTQKAISFVRQMNMYGFRKVDDCYYENDNFRRDRQHLLRNMIRRHPNKGLFVGLDHHQLAAAAAAQQALQVNQQLQQLEHQHKHRTEQALRLNSYLNNHHRFHQSHLSAAVHQGNSHHHHQLAGSQLQNHSSFEHMSSQLAAAASHLSQQQHQQQLGHHQNGHGLAPNGTGANQLQAGHLSAGLSHHAGSHLGGQVGGSLQPKKSRLLSNFYASAAAAAAAAVNNNNPTIHNQDSMHSTSSVDTEPSQCSSIVNSGSAGSPQPNSPSVLHQRLAALGNGHHQRHQSSSNSAATIRAAVLAAAQDPSIQNITNRFASNGSPQQLAATDLSNQSLATRQALHQTLVRSLLQLKQQQQQQQHPQDLLNNLQQQQQQNSRTLLESLASLSSAGTGSLMDPTSDSPTERTGTPPSSPPSPHSIVHRDDKRADYMDNNNMALDLAKSSSSSFSLKRPRELDDEVENLDDCAVDIEEEEEDETEVEGDADVEEDEADGNEVDDDATSLGADKIETAESLLDAEVKRARKYLKQESLESPEGQIDSRAELPQKKRIKLKLRRKKKSNGGIINNNNNSLENLSHADGLSVSAIARALILEICDRRGDQLDTSALQEAARYTECFLEVLLDDAALIARHSSGENGDNSPDNNSDGCDRDSESSSLKGSRGSRREGVVDPSSLSLALKLIPSKLLVAIQQQVSIKSQTLAVGGLN